MALNTYQQIQKAIEKSTNVLITFGKAGRGDAAGASAALQSVLAKLGKKAEIVSLADISPYFFLKNTSGIHSDFVSARKFIISLDISKTKVDELSYVVEDSFLNIFVTPKNGSFSSEDIKVKQGSFNYDLVLVLDTQDLDALNNLYENNAELFYETPIINIDHSPSNENFGEINVVDMPATSTCEVVYDIISSLYPNQLNEDIATMLLCGIIEETDCFKRVNVTPKSLSLASKLIDLGARREEIIANLYQTKTISMLRLWGRALARLKSEGGVYWSLLNGDDFAKSEASEKELPAVMADLANYLPNAEAVLLLTEIKKGSSGDGAGAVRVFAQSKVSGKNLLDVFIDFAPHGSKNSVEFVLDGQTILDAEKEVLEKVLG